MATETTPITPDAQDNDTATETTPIVPGAHGNEVVYEDRYIKLSREMLYIYKYFFPLGTHKMIPISEITHIWLGTDPALSLNFFKKKTWGIALSDVWWAFCPLREGNNDANNFVVKANDSGFFRHGFTVERRDEALAAFREVVPQTLQ